MTCQIEDCLCKQTNEPITEAVYGKKGRRGGGKVYESRGGTAPVWRTLSSDALDRLAERYPKARRFAARRAKEDR